MLNKIINNKYLGLIGIFIGLLGITLSIYFYLQSKEKRELVYAINPSKALIVDSKGSQSLQVFFENKEVSSDVVAVQIAIWNIGNLSIKRENILRNIFIKPLQTLQILEVKIRKISREVTKFNAKVDSLNNILIDWDILEKNDGAVIQILYSGNTETKFTIDGVIETQAGISQIEYDITNKAIKPIFVTILAFIMALLGYYILYKSKILLFTNKPKEFKLKLGLIIIQILLLYLPIALLIFGIYRMINEPLSVPFGF